MSTALTQHSSNMMTRQVADHPLESITNENTTALSAQSLTCGYRERAGLIRSVNKIVLEAVSVTLQQGEVLGVIGRNGAGKSTLLRVLSGALAPVSGTVQRYGNTVSLLSLQGGLLPYLSGKDNAVLMGVSLGRSKKEMLGRLNAIQEYSGLKEAFFTNVREYSSGMRARLCFSVAMQVRPDILLIDEMLSVGDAEFRERSLQSIQLIIAEGTAAVLVSHNLQLIQRICTSVIAIQGKSLSQKIRVESGEKFRQKLAGLSR